MLYLVVFRSVCIALLLIAFLSAPVSAAEVSCFTDLAWCFQNVAFMESFWYRTWEALDCELRFVACVRFAIFGL